MRSQRDVFNPSYTAVIPLKEGAFEHIDMLSRPQDRVTFTHQNELTKPIKLDLPLINQLADISINNNR